MSGVLEAPQTFSPSSMDRLAGKPSVRSRGVLVVDDDEGVRSLLGTFFRQQRIPVWLASDGEEAVEIYQDQSDNIAQVLLDVRMPDMDGPQTLRRLKEHDEDIVCYFMSDDWYPYTQEELLDMGATSLLLRPFFFKVLAHVVQCCLADV